MKKEYILECETEFDVEFYDTDPMNVVWHGNYVKYFEKARCALLNRVGYGYREMRDSGFAFPVTAITAKYIAPLRFGDRVRARAALVEYENCIKIRYTLRDAATGRLTTKGESSQMAFDIAGNASLFMCPRVFVDKVEALRARSC